MKDHAPYKPPRFLFNRHLETIFPALLRRVDLPACQRERIDTPDRDFLDLDWLRHPVNDKLVILSHGLEGDSRRPYIKGMARAFFNNGYDVLAWNFRGCSGEMNRLLRFYHSGSTDDLDTVIGHALNLGRYNAIFLVGFSLGGNITLKYLGEKHRSEVKRAVVFSVPLDLQTSCEKISKPSNWIYAQRFLRSLKRKVAVKASIMPELDTAPLARIRTLKQFDDHYTAPLHGFYDAADYYTQCSSIRFVAQIAIPTLIVNTLNDPFLSPACFPVRMLEGHPSVTLQILPRGGHVGFTQFNKNGLYWSEQRAVSFISEFYLSE